MALSPGTRLGPYEILGPLGAGGMGEVYRARDQRLGRDVAVKALPEAFAKEPERVSRFEREAKLLASLSHPNIGAIHGLEEVAGQRYLVLEYIQGESLAQRLARGPLPINEAIDVCRQIATGLEAAHESGIVHRDLKPGNVMLTEDGGVKVLDFGLAKGDDGGSIDPNLSASPTMTYAPTGAGVILGTAVYMSPEQARGKRVDRRTDIWSFGCVLFECMTGKQAFEGETVSDLIARILEREPDWSALPPKTPPRVRRLLERCLRKNSKERLRDIGDARIELAEPDTAAPVAQIPSRPSRMSLIPWLLAIGLGVALVVTLALSSRGPKAPPGGVQRFSIDTPGGGALIGYPGMFDLAPDGHALVFVMGDEQAGRLWIRSLDDVSCHPIEGTEHANFPFWSSDSRHIGFFSDGKLKRVAATGGAVQTICDAANGRGASWGASGIIVFSREPQGPLFKVDAQGGVPSQATVLDTTRGEISHRFPQFLPDGRHFLYGASPEAQGDLWNTCIGSLDDEAHGTPVVLATLVARYVSPGYLLFPRGQALLAQAFDGATTHGEAVQLEDLPNVSAPIALAWSTSSSNDGRLLVYGASERRPTDLVWFDRNGHRLQSAANHPGLLISPDLSPGTERLAVSEIVGTATKGWIFDLSHGTSAAMPSDGTLANPKWTWDNHGVAWLEQVPGINRILYLSADGGEKRTLLEDARDRYFEPAAWSPDSRSLLITENIPGHRRDLRILTPGQNETPTWVGTPGIEETPAFSNDGHWVAYASDISGRREIYLDSFPTPRGSKRVSSSGAGSVANAAFIAWRKDDRELYYVGPDGRTLLACEVILGADPVVGVPKVLFELPPEPWGVCAASDGNRFLVLVPVGQRPAAFTVVQNWTRELDKAK
jgi:eukaryotic-like serine/threonine-protein kinase